MFVHGHRPIIVGPSCEESILGLFPHNAEKTPHGQSDPQTPGKSSSRAPNGDGMK
jgi:hypothetical protein